MNWSVFGWIAFCCVSYVALCLVLLSVWDRKRSLQSVDELDMWHVDEIFERLVDAEQWNAETDDSSR